MNDPDLTPSGRLETWAPTGTLTIDTVASHWDDLRAQLQHADTVLADLSAVTRVDTAGVQLLLAARRAAEGRGRRVRVHAATLPPGAAVLLGITNEVVPVTITTMPAASAGEKG